MKLPAHPSVLPFKKAIDQYTCLNRQAVTDAAGNLRDFYTESAGYSAGAHNIRVKTMDSECLETEDRFVMSLPNPNFYIEQPGQNEIRLYHGGTISGPVVATVFNLDSVGS